MVDSNKPTIESIRDDALSLAHALRLVVDAYVYPYPLPLPEDKIEAALEAGRALGNHARLLNLYKEDTHGTPVHTQARPE